jgi:hypothetical protein
MVYHIWCTYVNLQCEPICINQGRATKLVSYVFVRTTIDSYMTQVLNLGFIAAKTIGYWHWRLSLWQPDGSEKQNPRVQRAI